MLDDLIEQFGDVLDMHQQAILLDARKRSGKRMTVLREALHGLSQPLRVSHKGQLGELISLGGVLKFT